MAGCEFEVIRLSFGVSAYSKPVKLMHECICVIVPKSFRERFCSESLSVSWSVLYLQSLLQRVKY